MHLVPIKAFLGSLCWSVVLYRFVLISFPCLWSANSSHYCKQYHSRGEMCMCQNFGPVVYWLCDLEWVSYIVLKYVSSSVEWNKTYLSPYSTTVWEEITLCFRELAASKLQCTPLFYGPLRKKIHCLVNYDSIIGCKMIPDIINVKNTHTRIKEVHYMWECHSPYCCHSDIFIQVL